MALLALFAFARPAHADVGAALNGGVVLDDNVFRLGASQAASASTCRRDSNGALGGEVRVAMGEGVTAGSTLPMAWSGVLKASAARSVYRCNRTLDATSGQADLSLRSPAIGHFNATLDVRLIHRLTPFEESRSSQINLQTLLRGNARAMLRITPDLSVLVQPTYLLSHNRAPSFRPLDYAQVGVDTGVVYTSPTGNSVGLRVRQAITRSRYAQIAIVGDSDVSTDLANNARERLVELDLLYAPGPFVSLSVNLGYAWRKDRRTLPGVLAFVRNDYQGLVGSATLGFQRGDRSRLDLSVTRQLASQNFLLATAARTTIYDATMRQKVATRLALSAQGRLIDQRSSYQLIEPTPVQIANRTLSLAAGATWDVTDRLGASLDLTHLERLRGRLIEPFAQNAVRLQLTYQMGTLP